MARKKKQAEEPEETQGSPVLSFDDVQASGYEFSVGGMCRLHLTAAWSDAVREEMDWPALDLCVKKADLIGEIIGSHARLTPFDSSLEKHEVQVGIESVGGFSMVAKEQDGATVKRRLKFSLFTKDANAPALFSEYLRTVGAATATLAVSHVTQERIDLSGEAPEAEQANAAAAAEEADVPWEKE
ncbi:MAG: hypothetical protein KGL39_56910 [Patescibacteria group bacterium]|nr:hypothetical protein [Patescibacteria group bacterium]